MKTNLRSKTGCIWWSKGKAVIQVIFKSNQHRIGIYHHQRSMSVCKREPALVEEGETSAWVPWYAWLPAGRVAIPSKALTGRPNQCYQEAALNKATILTVGPTPFGGKERCKLFAGSIALLARQTIDWEDQGSEAFPLPLIVGRVLCLLFLLVPSKNLLRWQAALGSSLHLSDLNDKDSGLATMAGIVVHGLCSCCQIWLSPRMSSLFSFLLALLIRIQGLFDES